jgi:hypothetical protein
MNDTPVLVLVLALAALLVGVGGLVVGAAALRRTTRSSRRLSRRNPATVPADLEGLRGEVQALRLEAADALRHLSVVRYDAFGDMGGRLSFTVALLDDASDGVVISSISGRSESRTYAKGVKSGASEQSLSPEEQQAIELAMRGTARTAGKGG